MNFRRDELFRPLFHMKSTFPQWWPLALTSAVLVTTAAGQTPAADGASAARLKLGHSAHGEAFDSGPRQKPWVMTGIGRAPLPISTKNPEVQRWFALGLKTGHSLEPESHETPSIQPIREPAGAR